MTEAKHLTPEQIAEETGRRWIRPIFPPKWRKEAHATAIREYEAKVRRNKRQEPCVYFVRSAGLIKIGFSSEVDKRLKALCAQCSCPVEELLVLPGSMRDERELHARFAEVRSHGEWFHASDDLLSLIDSLKCEGV